MKLAVVLLLLPTLIVTAQEVTRRISGTVKTVNNEPLPGVTVKIKETMAGTSTDQEGKPLDAVAKTAYQNPGY